MELDAIDKQYSDANYNPNAQKLAQGKKKEGDAGKDKKEDGKDQARENRPARQRSVKPPGGKDGAGATDAEKFLKVRLASLNLGPYNPDPKVFECLYEDGLPHVTNQLRKFVEEDIKEMNNKQGRTRYHRLLRLNFVKRMSQW